MGPLIEKKKRKNRKKGKAAIIIGSPYVAELAKDQEIVSLKQQVKELIGQFKGQKSATNTSTTKVLTKMLVWNCLLR